jgi:uncharacterized protein (DUF305 family)
VFAIVANREESQRMMTKTTIVIALLFVGSAATVALPAGAQEATPAAYSCKDVSASAGAGTPPAIAGMDMGSPMAGADQMTMELDQVYIDMMIPHHASIVAIAQAALPRLTDERLQEIAQTIIDTQSAETKELRGYREQFYGDPNPMPMDQGMMTAMMEMIPEMSGGMDAMAFQMDPEAQVAAFCAAENLDLAFIDLTIPHHQSAIESSEPVVDGAVHEEIGEFAQRVIEDQQREIEQLEAIRADLAGNGTPSA